MLQLHITIEQYRKQLSYTYNSSTSNLSRHIHTYIHTYIYIYTCKYYIPSKYLICVLKLLADIYEYNVNKHANIIYHSK